MAVNSIENGELPYSLEAEQAVLGSILLDPSCISSVTMVLKPEYFYLPQHKAIFSAMMLMYTKSKAIDPVVLVDTLTKSGKYDVSGGREYILQLQQSVPSAVNIGEYIKIVKEQYYLRTLINISNDVISILSVSVSRFKFPSSSIKKSLI